MRKRDSRAANVFDAGTNSSLRKIGVAKRTAKSRNVRKNSYESKPGNKRYIN